MFCTNLKRLRKEKGYTLEELAKKYRDTFGGGLSGGTLSKYELGKQEPLANTIYCLAKLLEVTPNELLGEKNTLIIDDERAKLLKAIETMSKDDLLKVQEYIAFVKSRKDE